MVSHSTTTWVRANWVLAFATLLLTLGLTAGWIINFGPQSFTFIYEHWIGLCTASLINSFVQATWCYYISTKKTDERVLALGGNSGNLIYDVGPLFPHIEIELIFLVQWFIGRELNPSIGSLDLKCFNELRPGLILWVLCNISSACEQLTRRGTWYPTDSMGLVLAFQGLYVADAIYNEVSRHLLSASVRRLTHSSIFIACCAYYDGHYNRRLWVHARRWRSCLGALCVLVASPIPRVQPHRARAVLDLRDLCGSWVRVLGVQGQQQ